MSETIFHFDHYTLRPASEADADELARWIEGDEDHRGRLTPEFFHQGPDALKLVDEQGTVFYLKMERVLRLHIQFGPNQTTAERERIRMALSKGLAWLRCKMAGKYAQIIFESSASPLIAFAIRALGFHRSANELVVTLGHAPALVQQEKIARG